MIKIHNLPDKIFGMNSRIFLLWLQPLALAIVIFMSVGLVIVPKINEIAEKVNEIKSVSNKTIEVKQKITYLQTMDQEEIKNNALKLASGLLPERNSYLLVKVIKDTATKANYNIDDFSISMEDLKDEETKKTNTNYDAIPVNITLIGPAGDYIALVKAIERSLPIMSINKFEMRSQNEVASIKLNVSAYYLRDITDLKLESLTLADLTPSQEEANLLLTISEYQTMTVENNDVDGEFVKYERQDPFF